MHAAWALACWAALFWTWLREELALGPGLVVSVSPAPFLAALVYWCAGCDDASLLGQIHRWRCAVLRYRGQNLPRLAYHTLAIFPRQAISRHQVSPRASSQGASHTAARTGPGRYSRCLCRGAYTRCSATGTTTLHAPRRPLPAQQHATRKGGAEAAAAARRRGRA